MDKLLEVLKRANADIDFANETDLVEEGLLSSFDIVNIVVELNEAYGIDIPIASLEPEQFENINTIMTMVKGYTGK